MNYELNLPTLKLLQCLSFPYIHLLLRTWKVPGGTGGVAFKKDISTRMTREPILDIRI